jgi:hypothetical protein
MLMRRKTILAAASVACALPAAPAMADGPTNSATANAANVSYTTQNAPRSAATRLATRSWSRRRRPTRTRTPTRTRSSSSSRRIPGSTCTRSAAGPGEGT